MDLQLKGKTVLITGSTKGIGLEMALTFAEEGCNVGVCARKDEEVKATVKRLQDKGVKAYGAVVDVTDSASMTKWVDDSAAALGGIDGFIANASAGGADTSEEGWRSNFETDMLATWKGVNAVLPYLEKSKSGSIVAISSIAAFEAFAGAAPYAAMKAAVLNYAGNLAIDLAPQGIRVNSVSPGPIFMKDGAWDQIKQAAPDVYEGALAKIPFGRMGSASEVATQVALLISPLSGFTTGTNVVIDGCFTKRLQF